MCVYEAVHQGHPNTTTHSFTTALATPPNPPHSLTPPHHRIVDNLPVATRVKSELRPDDVYYVRGFPVGATGASW